MLVFLFGLGNDINNEMRINFILLYGNGCFGYFVGRLNVFRLLIIFSIFMMIVELEYDVCV